MNNPEVTPSPLLSNNPDLTRALNWLLDRILLIKPGEVLNPGRAILSNQNQAQALRKAAKELTAEAIDDSAEHINYAKLAKSESYNKFRQYTLSLPMCDIEDIGDREDQIAFWINLYNTIVVHGIIELGVVSSVREITNFFSHIYYEIGEYTFSAEDIEHGILRANSRPPYRLFPLFRRNDPRRQLSLKRIDPRIHFALVCGSDPALPSVFMNPVIFMSSWGSQRGIL